MPYPIKQITIEAEEYPQLLREIPGAPKVIRVRGDLPTKDDVLVAMVGTRKVTLEGRLTAKQIAKDLARSGIVIVSGLALGIDTASHEGALAGGGRTLAVLANGLDEVYPRTNFNLAQEILKNGGALISEYPEGTPSFPNQFLERNRIVSGLCGATIIIEAPIHSGALVTARHALDQGREIFVTPGPARHPNYEGSHMLLRNGARIIRSAADAIEDLNLGENLKIGFTAKKVYDAESAAIINLLKEAKKSLTLDNIVETTKLQPHIVAQRITFLILDGAIEEKNNRYEIS